MLVRTQPRRPFVVPPCWYGGAAVNRFYAGSIPAATAWKSTGWMRSLSRKQVAALRRLRVRVSRLPLDRKTNGPVAKRLRQHSYKVTSGGSTPSGTTEPINQNPIYENNCPRGAARSARRPVTAEAVGSNPIGDAETFASVGHWQASVAVTHPPSGSAGSTPVRRTLMIAIRPSDETGDMRRSERRAIHGVGVQLSPWLLKLRVGQRPLEPHKLDEPGATPGPATLVCRCCGRTLLW